MTLPSEPCHSGGVFMVAKFKKDWQNLTLMTRSETLSVGPNMVNDSLLRALSHWWRVYGRKI